MPQAKSFSSTELTQVLTYVQTTKHNVRNRAMLLLTHWGGLRVGEVAALRICDVLDGENKVKSEIRLLPEQTKGRHPRTVFLNERLKAELQAFANEITIKDRNYAFFPTQKFPKRGFTANTLTQHFKHIYKESSRQIGIARIFCRHHSLMGQLKIAQEVITLSVFVPFAVFYMGEPFKTDYIWAGLCLLGAVYFMFRS